MKQKTIVIRYSQAFKHQVIKEIEDGLVTITEAKSKYGIKGAETIQLWMRRMGKFGSLPKMIRVEKPDEKAKIKDLEKQIRQLKESLADTQVRYLMAESQFEIVCEQQGLDPEEVKKKLEQKNSAEQ
jgi:transposase-like protein